MSQSPRDRAFDPTSETREWHAAATPENAEKIARKLGGSNYSIKKAPSSWGLSYIVVKED